jgi:capsular polysaccharide biosynthesis protein
MLQKPAGSHRSVINIEQLMDRLKMYIEPEFELKIESGNLTHQILFFRSVKCLMGVRGSGLTNVMWMAPDTVLIEIQTWGCDPVLTHTAVLCGLWVFATTSPFAHSYAPFVIHVTMIVDVVRKAFALMKWNERER